MRRTNVRTAVTAVSSAALLTISAACGTENGEGDTPDVDQVTEQVEDATAGDDQDGQDGDGMMDDLMGDDDEMVELDAAGETVEVPQEIADKYQELEQEGTPLGAPVGELEEFGDGHMIEFAEGAIAKKDGDAYAVMGAILEEYKNQGGPEGELGFPTSDEMADDQGQTSTFENGTITFDGMEATVEMD